MMSIHHLIGGSSSCVYPCSARASRLPDLCPRARCRRFWQPSCLSPSFQLKSHKITPADVSLQLGRGVLIVGKKKNSPPVGPDQPGSVGVSRVWRNGWRPTDWIPWDLQLPESVSAARAVWWNESPPAKRLSFSGCHSADLQAPGQLILPGDLSCKCPCLLRVGVSNRPRCAGSGVLPVGSDEHPRWRHF
jgi:hypothetical protein